MQPITALSYNIHECVGSDRRRDPTRVAQVIRDSGAQIIGLQEVHSDGTGAEELHQMNYLARATGLQAVSGPSVERRNGHYGNVLLTSCKILAVTKSISPIAAENRAAPSMRTSTWLAKRCV